MENKTVIVYKTNMEKIPENCAECLFCDCGLPVMKTDDSKIKKEYMKKRHRLCPLIEIASVNK